MVKEQVLFCCSPSSIRGGGGCIPVCGTTKEHPRVPAFGIPGDIFPEDTEGSRGPGAGGLGGGHSQDLV